MGTMVSLNYRRMNMIKAQLFRWFSIKTSYVKVRHIKSAGADFFSVRVNYRGEIKEFTVDFAMHFNDENETFKTMRRDAEKVFV